MIADLKPYPAYKDSGVPSLGQVPEHWEVQPLGRIGRLSKGNGGSKVDEVSEGIPCVRYGDLYTRHEFFIRETKACVAPERAATYTKIHHGDVLFAASGETIDDIGRSAENLLDCEARCGGDVLLLRPTKNFEPGFLGYAADSPASRSQKARMGRGFTIVHIYASELKGLVLAVPPLPEQAAIVRFLDHANRRIRHYIAAKRKLIALLNEQKQAIIHRAVTRGLDPNVRLKPSGVEWLGDVPAHWTLKRFKFVTHITSGQVDPRVVPYRDYVLIAPNHIESGTGRLLNVETADAQGAISGKYLANLGQIIYSKIRPNLRKATLAYERCLCSADMYAVTPKQNELRAEYLLLLMLSLPFTRYAIDCSLRVAMPKINRDALGNCWLWYPRLSDQDVILEKLEIAIGPLEQAIGHLEEPAFPE